MAFPSNPVNGQKYDDGTYIWQYKSMPPGWTKIGQSTLKLTANSNTTTSNTSITTSNVSLSNTSSNTSVTVTPSNVSLSNTSSNTSVTVTPSNVSLSNTTSNTSVTVTPSNVSLSNTSSNTSTTVTSSNVTLANTSSNTSVTVTPSNVTLANTSSNTSVTVTPSNVSLSNTTSNTSVTVTPSNVTLANTSSNTSVTVTPSNVSLSNTSSNTSVTVTPSNVSLSNTSSNTSTTVTPSNVSLSNTSSNTSVTVTPSNVTVANTSSNTSVTVTPSNVSLSNTSSNTSVTVTPTNVSLANTSSNTSTTVTSSNVSLSNTTSNTSVTVTSNTVTVSSNVANTSITPSSITVSGNIYANYGIFSDGNTVINSNITTSGNVIGNNFIGNLTGNVTGTASNATILETARYFITSGDAVAPAVSFNGSSNVDLVMTLANSGVTSGTYGNATAIPVFTVDSKGRVISANTTPISTTLAIAGNTGTDNVSMGVDTLTFEGDVGQLAATVTDNKVSYSIKDGANIANLNVLGALTVSGDTVVSGNLTVNGTQTIVNSTTVTVDDAVIRVNSDGAVANAGIEANIGGSIKSFVYVPSTNKWTAANGTLVAEAFESNTLILDSIANTTVLFSDAGNIAGNANFTFNKSSSLVHLSGVIEVNSVSFNNGASISTASGSNNVDVTAGTGGYAGLSTADANALLWVEADGTYVASNYLGTQNVWHFDTTGNISLPRGATISANAGNGNVDITAGIGGYAALTSNNSNTSVWSEDDGAYVATNLSGSIKAWHFDNSGNLTLPGDSKFVTLGTANLDIYPGSGGYAALTSFDNNTTMWVEDSSNGAYIATNFTGSQKIWNFATSGNTSLPGNVIFSNAGKISVAGSNIDLVSAANGYIALTSQDSNSTMWVENDGAYISTDFGNAQFAWHFDSNGNLSLPRGAVLSTSAGNSNVDLTAGPNGYAAITSNNGNSTIWAENDAAYISTDFNGSQFAWEFANTGVLSLPGNLNVNSHKIINVVDPTSDQDAATKKYVDDQVSGSSGTGVVTGVIFVPITDYGSISTTANMTVDFGSISDPASYTSSYDYVVDAKGIIHEAYTVAHLPSPSVPGQMIYVSNESGGATMAFSDGANWRRITDRAIVS